MPVALLFQILLGLILLLGSPGIEAAEIRKGSLRAGAARADITPAEDSALPMSGYAGRGQGHKGIHDRLYARAIVAGDGTTEAAIIGLDLIGVPHPFWETTSSRIERETGIPAQHILLAGTHTHAGPNLSAMARNPSADGTAYLAALENNIVSAVRQAREKLQPARMGFGTGAAHVNMNRRARMAGGGWWLGWNPEGPSDKTVAVLKFESMDGRPLAILVNYSVHGTVLGPRNFQISGDLPGATSRFIEKHYGESVVVPWTSGAAGDQNPIYRTGTRFDEADVLGQLLGEEVIRVADRIKTSPRAHLRGAQKVVSCPGKKNPPGPRRRPDQNYQFLDAEPAEIRLSLLMLNHTALTGVSGEVLTGIGTRLKKESPFAGTVMLTHCNGSSGYLPDDAAYDQVSYEIVTSRVKRGCAEDAIVNGLLDLMDSM